MFKRNFHPMVFSPADDTGAGDPAPVAGEGEAAAAGQGEPAAGEAGEAAATPPAGKSSILDFAPKGEAAPAGDGDPWKAPDGLEIPDHLLGTSAEDTLAKLSTAYKGARQELSTRKKADGVLDGSVPKDLDGYTFDSLGDPKDDPVLADLTSEASKPIVDQWRKAALEVGIPDGAFAAFMQKGMANMAAEGLGVTTDPEQAAQISGEAEMANLTEALGSEGASLALRQLDTFAQKLANKGILQDKGDVEEFGQMVGTAKAAMIMQRIITAEFGEQAIPRADGVEGAPTQEEAYQAYAAAKQIKDPADRQEAVARAQKMLDRAMQGSSTTGQVRSKVL